jgi:hypothetical protein
MGAKQISPRRLPNFCSWQNATSRFCQLSRDQRLFERGLHLQHSQSGQAAVGQRASTNV